MNETNLRLVVVEEEIVFTLHELSRASGSAQRQILDWVHEGVLSPAGSGPEDWRFDGPSLRIARMARRLVRDFDLSVGGLGMVLDLMERIEALEARLKRAGST